MILFQAIVLGVVQGVTEFLPVSSSGHLVLFPALLGWKLQDVAFDAVVHLATLLVMVIYFRRDILEIVKHHRRIAWMMVLAVIPIGLVGLYLERIPSLRTLPVVFISLAVWGIVLMIADRKSKMEKRKSKMEEIGWKRTLLIGVVQALALIPGTSRSGITVTAGLFVGLDKNLATRMAFLVGIPAIALAGLKKSFDVVSGTADVELLPLVFGFIASFVSGYLAVFLLMKLVKQFGFFWFGVYRILLATLLFLVWLQSLYPPV